MIGGSLVGPLALAMVGLAPNLPVFFAAWLVAKLRTAAPMAAASIGSDLPIARRPRAFIRGASATS